MTNGTVTKIEPAENNTKFTVTTVYEDKSEQKITTRKVVLATGLHDILPKTPGVEENWGEGIYWCPWCDGHEHADQPLGFLAPLDQVPGMVREILTLNRDIIAFVNGTDTPTVREATTKKETGDWQAFLKIHGVRIENRTISEIVRLKNGSDGHADPSLPSVAEFDSFNVGFETGDPVERAAFFASFKDEQASKIGQDVGVKLYNGRLAVDPTKGLVTNIPGIYAIGDANSDNVTNVPHALFSGKRTAVYLHGEFFPQTIDNGDVLITMQCNLDVRMKLLTWRPTRMLRAREICMSRLVSYGIQSTVSLEMRSMLEPLTMDCK